jgi:putative FmdB family regulatory protein
MPSYDYVCTETACAHAWTEDASIHAAARTDCPQCKQESAKRLISGGAQVRLLGQGWYRDGYATKPQSR